MENEKFVYVVMGTTGEYSDRIEWVVIAYDNETKAQQHVTLATQEAHRICFLSQRLKKYWGNFERIHDPNMECIITL